jgi:non-specific serine/threonine protein kinase
MRKIPKSNDWDIEQEEATGENKIAKTIERYGLVIQQNTNEYPFLTLSIVRGEVNEEGTTFVGKVEKIDLPKFVTPEEIKEEDRNLLQTVRKLQSTELTKYLNKNSPFMGIWDTILHAEDASLPVETKELIQEYMHPKLEKLWRDISEHPFNFHLPANKPFTTANLQKAELVFNAIQPSFKVEKEADRYVIYAQVNLPEGKIALDENHAKSHYIFQYHHQFFTWKKLADLQWVEKFMPTGYNEIDLSHWPEYLQHTLLPLSKMYKVELGNVKQEKLKGVKPQLQILLKEDREYLLFEPIYIYKDIVVTTADGPSVIQQQEDKFELIF